jgi:acetyl-CoA acetyltransferase
VSTVYLVGVGSTSFKRQPERSHKELVREAILSTLGDAQCSDGQKIDSLWFGTAAMAVFGQSTVGGQVCMAPLVEDGILGKHVPVMNVEGGCATGSVAVHGAWKDILTGQHDFSLAVGVDKTFIPQHPEKMLTLFDGAIDQLDANATTHWYEKQAARCGLNWSPHDKRSLLMDICVMQAEFHMRQFGVSAKDIAAGAAKNYAHGVLNPKCGIDNGLNIQEVLDARSVLGPLTRPMCASVNDGAAAVLLCGDKGLGRLSVDVQQRALRVSASVLGGGSWRSLEERSSVVTTARKAYGMAGLEPNHIDVVELHDATSFAELSLVESLGFCDLGEGARYICEGEASLGGTRPTNVSGGLVAKGHPLAATGIGMIEELALQLRGEAGDRQVPGARLGLQHNGGGLIGFDEAVSSIMIFEAEC